jgi:hypothetical protein
MSPPSLVSSRSSQQAEEADQPSPEIPSADTSLGAGLGGFDSNIGLGMSSVGKTSGLSVLAEESGIVDVGWEFDEHGNMIDIPQAVKPPINVPSVEQVPGTGIATDSGISARIRQEHAEGLQAAQQVSLRTD